MATQGPNFPTAATGFPRGLTAPWTNPTNAETTNSVDATSSLNSTGNTQTDFLQVTGFGFSVPANATINGFTVVVRKHWTAGSPTGMFDDSLLLMKAGIAAGTDHADTTTNWSNAYTNTSYGNGTDLWGQTWTPADVNASNFGVQFAARDFTDLGVNFGVDSISVTVFYTVPAVGVSCPGFKMF